MAATRTNPAPSAGKRSPEAIRAEQEAEQARRHDRVRWTYAQKRAARLAVAT